MSFEGFSIFFFFFFGSGGHFVQPTRMILAILVMGHLRNIAVKLFCIWAVGLGGDVV